MSRRGFRPRARRELSSPPLQVSEEALGARCNAWVRKAFFLSLSSKCVILMSVEESELLRCSNLYSHTSAHMVTAHATTR